MPSEPTAEFLERFLDAWNSGEPARVAALYAQDLVYRDPNTIGEIRDQESFLRYLAKLLASWNLTWTAKESFELTHTDGWAFLWRAVIRSPDGKAEVTLDGMDLMTMKDGKIARNEVYFDRTILAPLMSG